MESYTTIEKYSIFEYEDRKSVFIAEASPIATEKEALDFIARIKKKYPDANHHVYAYVLRENSTMRFSDDREPQGTAGMPVLDAIRKNGCTDAVIVVTRYFGGTLLGTGGLVHAYGASAISALKGGNLITYNLYAIMSVKLSYSDYQKIGNALGECKFYIEDVKYSDSVEVRGKILLENKEDLIKKLNDITSGRCEIEILDEKFDFIPTN